MAETIDPALRAHAAQEAEIRAAAAPLARMGGDVIRAVALVNGIAAVATLAMMLVALRDLRALSFWLIFPLALFGFGATVAAFSTGFAYFAQSREVASLRSRAIGATPPGVAETEASRAQAREAERFRRFGTIAIFVAMASAVAGFLLSGAVLLIQLG